MAVTTTVNVAGRIDRLPPFSMHRRVLWLVGLGMFFDLYDIFLGGYLNASFRSTYHLSTLSQSFLIGSAYFGAFFGALFFGFLADRFGRKTMYQINLAIYSLFSLAAAFAPSPTWVIVLRFFAGLGLGAELPLGDAYLSEMIPANRRGRLIAYAYTIGFCGNPVAGLIAYFLINPGYVAGWEGWRWAFVIGALGAVLILWLRRSLPESPRWQEIHGNSAEAERLITEIETSCIQEKGLSSLPEPIEVPIIAQRRIPFAELFAGPYARRTLMLWIFQILQTVGYYGFGSLVPTVLATEGFSVVHSFLYSALLMLGYPIGSALSLLIVERVERKWLIVGSGLGMALFGVLFGIARTPALILTWGFLYTCVSNIYSNGFHIYQAEIYPTRARGTAVGTAYGLSRLTSALQPFFLLPILIGLGPTTLFAVIACVMAATAADVGLLGPKTTGRPLEEVST